MQILKGKFLTLDGIDGSGKSTCIKMLHQYLLDKNVDVVSTKEIGGTPFAEKIREIVLHTETDNITDILLIYAARRNHVETLIKPALAKGQTVLCDRFSDATYCYQGMIGHAVEAFAIDDFQPHLTFWLDIDIDTAIERMYKRGNTDKFENLNRQFFTQLAANYQQLYEQNSDRIIRIDANGTQQQVFERIVVAYEEQ